MIDGPRGKMVLVEVLMLTLVVGLRQRSAKTEEASGREKERGLL